MLYEVITFLHCYRQFPCTPMMKIEDAGFGNRRPDEKNQPQSQAKESFHASQYSRIPQNPTDSLHSLAAQT